MQVSRRDLARLGIASAFVSGIALQAGTQATAWWYDHQASLGWYLFDLPEHGVRVYPPWDIVVWYLQWSHLFPVQVGAFVSLAVAGFAAWCAHKHRVLPWRGAGGVIDAPEWGTERDLRRHGLLSKGVGGVVLGMLRDKRLVTYRGDQPVLFDGGTGAGKTSGGVIPFILSADSDSVLVNDPKGELWDMTGRHRGSLGNAGYFDPLCADTLRINPFSTVRFGTEHEVRDVSNLIRIAVSGVGMRADSATADYYQRRTRPLMVAIALHIANDLGKQVTFGGMRRMIPDFAAKHLKDMLKSKQHSEVSDAAKNFERYGSDAKSGTLEGIEDALAVFADPHVDRATSESDFDVNDMMAGDAPRSLYLRSRFPDQDRLRPLMLLMMRYIVSKLLFAERECDDGRAKLRTLSLVLEEIGDARDEWIVDKLIVMRSSGLRPVMAAQSMKLLKGVYGTLNTIDENCYAIVRYSSIGQDEQALISGDAGQRLETVERVSRKHGPFFREHDKTVSTAQHKSPLMSRADVRGLPDDMQVVTVKGCKPAFLLRKPVWFEHPVLKLRGDNVRGGATRPGQMPWVLDMHRARQQASASVRNAANADNPLKIIADRTGWDAVRLSNEVFGKVLAPETVKRWIAGTKPIPASRLEQAEKFLAQLDAAVSA